MRFENSSSVNNSAHRVFGTLANHARYLSTAFDKVRISSTAREKLTSKEINQSLVMSTKSQWM